MKLGMSWMPPLAILLIAALFVAPGFAQDASELAKKTQNPIADLISLPLQSNFNFGAGSKDKMIYLLNIQPVIPISLNADWNLITRVIMPVINQPSLFPGTNGATGLGDFNPSLFFSPAKPGKIIWGVGPTMTIPTATDRDLGAGKWSMGPTGVALMMKGHWVFGGLMNNQWSVGGWGDKNVNKFLLQPFLNYNLPDGWYLTSSPIVTSNWKADSGERWTIPVGGGFGKVFRIGKQPINTQLAAYGNVERPKFGPDWQLRFQVQFLFPK